MGLIAFTGRTLFASLFLLSAGLKVMDIANGTGQTMAFVAPKMDQALADLHHSTGLELPLSRSTYPFLLLGAVALELVGGMLFVLNSKLGATMLLMFLVPTTAVMHDFWRAPNGSKEHQAEFIQFMKNMCLIGGVLMHLGTANVGGVRATKHKAQ